MKTKPLTFLLALTFLFLFSGSVFADDFQFLFLFSGSVFADDFQDATDAYERKDYETAYKLILPLAEQGYAEAQYNLGIMYSKGQGVQRNFHKKS